MPPDLDVVGSKPVYGRTFIGVQIFEVLLKNNKKDQIQYYMRENIKTAMFPFTVSLLPTCWHEFEHQLFLTLFKASGQFLIWLTKYYKM